MALLDKDTAPWRFVFRRAWLDKEEFLKQEAAVTAQLDASGLGNKVVKSVEECLRSCKENRADEGYTGW